MRRLIAVFALLLASATAPADEGANRIAAQLGARLEQVLVLRAEFVQSKQMAAFKKPLQTRGRLVFAREQGVLWQIEQPLKLTYVLQENRMLEIGDDGSVQVRASKDQPGIAQIGRIFRALLGGQTKALSDLFDASGNGDAEHGWTLTLTPRTPQVAQFIRRIALSGTRHVESIRIEEAGGDAATIRFRQIGEANSLTLAEGLLFKK